MKQNQRALTLIELLLALSLLSAIVAAAAVYINIAGHIGASALEPSRMSSAAHAALELIQDDLTSGDWQATAPQDVLERITVHDGMLDIKTRSPGVGGPVIHQYRFDELAGRLSRVEQVSGKNARQRLLVSGIHKFACQLINHEPQDQAQVPQTPQLIVNLQLTSDAPAIARRYLLR